MSFFLNGIPDRSSKPRSEGITLVLDKGLSVREAEDLCESSASYIDIIKLGWGTSYVTQNLNEKLAVYSDANIDVYFGGTLFEAYVMRDQLDKYMKLLNSFNIEHAEVSNGTIWLSQKKKIEIINKMSKYFTIFSEVGSKNPKNNLPPYKWVEMIEQELNAGASKIIAESRESGTVGVFRKNGEVRTGLIDQIVSQTELEDLIFEAPKKSQQVWFIKKFGSSVNLGNIPTDEVIPLETLRRGLRGDTLLELNMSGEENKKVS